MPWCHPACGNESCGSGRTQIPNTCEDHIVWALEKGKYNLDNREDWYPNILKLSDKSSWDDLTFEDFAHLFYCARIIPDDCFDNSLKPRCGDNGEPRSCGKF